MPLFTYRATNDDNKETRGSIDASDEQNARKALEDLSLDVLEISEASRAKQATGEGKSVPEQEKAEMPVFAFEGKDATGLVRRGTLQASTKYEAFKRLQDDQKLTLTMLSPVGVLPQYKDPELDQWQRRDKKALPEQSVMPQPKPVPAPKVTARPTIGFTNIIEPSKKVSEPKPAPAVAAKAKRYHSMSSTLRLYAGWLLAWYGVFVAVGYYAVQRALPWDIPFVEAFYLSQLIFSFMIAIFVFLLLSTVHRVLKGGMISGIALTILGIGVFLGVRMLA